MTKKRWCSTRGKTLWTDWALLALQAGVTEVVFSQKWDALGVAHQSSGAISSSTLSALQAGELKQHVRQAYIHLLSLSGPPPVLR